MGHYKVSIENAMSGGQRRLDFLSDLCATFAIFAVQAPDFLNTKK
jgi:hypothetical protein